MGLGTLGLYLLAGQFVLQMLALVLVLGSSQRPDDAAPGVGAVIGKALVVTISTIMLQVWLSERIGWLVIAPALFTTVVVLTSGSWKALWSSCLIVAVSCSLFTLLMGFLAEDTGTGEHATETAREKEIAPAPVRYQQIAEAIDDISGKANVATPVAEVDTPDVLHKQPPPVEDTTDDALDETEQLWRAARGSVQFRGSMSVAGHGPVYHINDAIYHKNDVLQVTHEGMVYRWLVKGGSSRSVDLEPLDATPVERR